MPSPIERFCARIAPGYDSPNNTRARARIGELEGWVSIVANTLLGAVKLWIFFLTGSITLLADAVHTFADSATSLVVVIGFVIARKPPDQEHPFGHGRAENIATLTIAVLLGVAAVEMGITAVERLLDPAPVAASPLAIVVIALTMLAKAALTWFSGRLGKLIDSDALIADARHHGTDVAATGLVLIAFLAGSQGYLWLDGALALAVALLIAWVAYDTLARSVGPLLGQIAPAETLRVIRERAIDTDGVCGVHDVTVHQYGAIHAVSLHIEVEGNPTLARSHEISDAVERAIVERFPGTAVVHVDQAEVTIDEDTGA